MLWSQYVAEPICSFGIFNDYQLYDIIYVAYDFEIEN
jgi:hypothetical protein